MASASKLYKKLGPTEKGSIEKFLVDHAREHDNECIKLGFLKGIPDRLYIKKGGKVFFLETKTRINDLSSMQKWWINRLRALGFVAECVRTRQAALEILGKQ